MLDHADIAFDISLPYKLIKAVSDRHDYFMGSEHSLESTLELLDNDRLEKEDFSVHSFGLNKTQLRKLSNMLKNYFWEK